MKKRTLFFSALFCVSVGICGTGNYAYSSTSIETPTEKHVDEDSPAASNIKTLKACEAELVKLNQTYDWENDRYCGKYKSWLDAYLFQIKEIKRIDPNFDLSPYESKEKEWRTMFNTNAYPVDQDEEDEYNFEQEINKKAYLLNYLLEERIGSGAGWVHSYFKTNDYLESAKEANYPALLQLATEGDEKYPEHTVVYKVNQIKEFKAKYITYYTETLKPVINELIEEAYSNKAGNGQEAVKYAKQAKELADAASIVLPENGDISDLNKDATQAYNSIRETVFGKIFTSDFHKENSGKVVFFTEKPVIKEENSSTVSNTYKAGEFIYAMAYLDGTFKDLAEATNDITVSTNILVDGNVKTSHEFVMNWAYLKEGRTYLFMEIVPDPSTNKHSGPAKFAKELAQVSPRNHTVTVSLTGMQIGSSYVRDFAEGSFKLDCSEGQDKLSEYALIYREKSLAKIIMPSAKMTNADLANSMKQALINEGWEDNKTIKKVVITGSDWEVHTDRITGKIVYRSIPAAVAFQTFEGECKYWNLTFKQTYDGSAYQSTELGAVGSIVELACANVK